jgi:hypothetical protein
MGPLLGPTPRKRAAPHASFDYGTPSKFSGAGVPRLNSTTPVGSHFSVPFATSTLNRKPGARCRSYDFVNIFAKKIRKNWCFCSKYCVFANIES